MNPLWSQLALRADVTLTEAQLAALSYYLDLLLEANERMNLTRIEDRASAEVLHVGDALTLMPFLPRGAHALADVGSGGGVPGIPLAIARPDAQVTLIESTQKKGHYLVRTVQELGLKNVRIEMGRAEAVGAGRGREQFDVVAARAVALLNVLTEWCMPLAKKGGKFLAMKGAKGAEELAASKNAIQKLSGGVAVVHPVELPGADHHVIIEIPKIGKTDARFPRDTAVMKKTPL